MDSVHKWIASAHHKEDGDKNGAGPRFKCAAVEGTDTIAGIRGLCASSDILPRGEVLAVPYECFLCTGNALRCLPPLRAFVERLPPAVWHSSACRNRDELVQSCALVILRFHPDYCTVRYDPSRPASEQPAWAGFSTFVATLPGPDEMTNASGWDPALEPSFFLRSTSTTTTSFDQEGGGSEATSAAVAGWSQLRRAKLGRWLSKRQSEYEYLQAEVLSKDRSGLFEHVDVARWRWAGQILASRCFSYLPPDEDAVLTASIGRGVAQEDVSPTTTVVPRANRRGIVRRRTTGRRGSACDREEEKDNDADETNSSTSDASSSTSSSTSSDDVSVEDSDEDTCDAFTLVPLCDLCNHTDATAASCDFEFDPLARRMVFTAGERGLRKGDPIHIRYNGMTAWRFAKYYGFVPQYKPSVDSHPVQPPSIPTTATDVISVTKRRVMAEFAIPETVAQGEPRFPRCFVTSRGPNRRLLGLLRTRCLAKEDLPRHERAFLPAPVSTLNEWQTYKMLTALIEEQLRSALPDSTSSGSLSAPTSVAIKPWRAACEAMVARDRRVLTAAREFCAVRRTELAECLYYGTTKNELARRTVLQEQLERFRDLKAQGGEGSGPAASARLRQIPFEVEREAGQAVAQVAPTWRHRVTDSPAV